MEVAHQKLSNACVLVSRAAGALQVACAEYEAAQLTLKKWQLTHSEPNASAMGELAEGNELPPSLGGTELDSVLEQARNFRSLSLREASKSNSGRGRSAVASMVSPNAPRNAAKHALPREFIELKERYQCAIAEGGILLLDIQAPVGEKSKKFMDTLSSRERHMKHSSKDKGGDGTMREDFVRAQAVLKALGWIQHVLSEVNWGRLRHDELSIEELCDNAYLLGNVVRLWKECVTEIESFMGTEFMKVLRRRDAFLKLLSQSKKLRYPNRRLYLELEKESKHQMESTRQSNFLTWLPDECWHYDAPPSPPEPSLKCSRDHYVKIAVGQRHVENHFFWHLTQQIGSQAASPNM